MERRTRVRVTGVAAGVAVLGLLAGCSSGSGKNGLRWPGQEKARVTEDSGYDLDLIRDGTKIELPDDTPQGVLKPTRGAGTWSSEARDIERSLGVGP
jgi:hypothetical protein